MVWKIAGLLALLVAARLTGAAQDAKKDAPKVNYIFGSFESYKNEILTLKVDDKEKKFKVPGDTPVGYSAGKDKTKVLKAKDHLKDVKKGSAVTVTLDNDGKKVLAVGVFVTELPGDKPKDQDEEKDKYTSLQPCPVYTLASGGVSPPVALWRAGGVNPPVAQPGGVHPPLASITQPRSPAKTTQENLSGDACKMTGGRVEHLTNHSLRDERMRCAYS